MMSRRLGRASGMGSVWCEAGLCARSVRASAARKTCQSRALGSTSRLPQTQGDRARVGGLAGGAASSWRRPVAPLQRAFSVTRWRSQATPVDDFDLSSIERPEDEVDLLIVGAGPAGLSAAIKFKQLAAAEGKDDLRVVVLEKGSEVGSHILSGAVIEPRSFNELWPNEGWKELGAPLNQPATSDTMKFLTKTKAFPMPHPPQMNNKGNYIVSLNEVCRWLGEQAEAAGVEIYPGFAGSEVLYGEDGTVTGVATNDIGLDKQYQPKDNFERGMAFKSKVTLLGEGCHGSLSQSVIKRYSLRQGKQEQTYGLGVKEIWEIDPKNHEPGKVIHTMGWPLKSDTYGGSWCYHYGENLVSIGLVVGLDYPNPHLAPFQEFQKMKTHPFYKEMLKGGRCIMYGARALNEGGFQSIPKLTFPGGALIGCSAGFLNVPKIKGTHTAMKSGIEAGEAAFKAIVGNVTVADGDPLSMETSESGTSAGALDMSGYQKAMENSWVWQELKEVRNLRPSFHGPLGFWGGLAYSGLDSYILKGRTPWTLNHPGPDHSMTKTSAEMPLIEYPKADGELTFDILTSVSRTGTNHAENQPVHLKVPDHAAHAKIYNDAYKGLEKYCPAAVYDYDEEGKFVINSQNCIHCKTCSIKAVKQDVTWAVPEGGGGPKYTGT